MLNYNIVSPIQQAQHWQEIFVEERVCHYSWVVSFLNRLGNIPITMIQDIGQKINEFHNLPYPSDPYGFQRLLIGKQQTEFIRICPCSPHTIRCGYFFISLGLGCPIDCSYCFLQGFLNTPFPVIYANLPDLELELDIWEKKLAQQNCYVRAGTGEMTDSLVFDPITQLGKYLIERFHRWPHLILELKTKSIFVQDLFPMSSPNVVLGWSLTPSNIAAIEEPFAPDLLARLQSAQQATQAGYAVGFHFDPIIAVPDWREQYYETLQLLFKMIPPERIAWISLGTFRIFPILRDIIRERHPKSKTLQNELIIAYDGKLRYFRPTRVQIYRTMRNWIEQLGQGKVPIYLCMESEQVWHDVFGTSQLPNLFQNVTHYH